MASEPPDDAPSIEDVSSLFRVTAVRTDDDAVRYVGEPLVPPSVLERRVAPVFYERGYEVSIESSPTRSNGGRTQGEFVLVATPRTVGIDGIPWKNIVLALLTVGTTLYAGAQWYYLDLSNPLTVFKAWPFSLAILSILGVHEFGHYFMSRYHRVEASLPYFIPVPPPFGTMGAIIRMRGRIPSRKALFDIGVAGPLAGFVMTVIVAIVGMQLDPVMVPQSIQNDPQAAEIFFQYPLLHVGLAKLLGVNLSEQFNPVVFASWIGALVTFLNLIPVGQLDGGHISRSLFGKRQETFAALVPGVLFALAGYLYFFTDVRYGMSIWIVWGIFTTLLAYFGPANPIRDEPLDRRRRVLGFIAFGVGVICFMPVPIQIALP